MKSSLYLFVFLIFSFSSYSQGRQGMNRESLRNAREAQVTGKIIDRDSQKPIEFTSVALYKQIDSTLVTGSISKADGSFEMKNLPYGKYYLVANFIGFEKHFLSDILLTPRNKKFEAGSIILAPAAKELDEVEVVAEQAHVEYRIDRKIVTVSQDINAATGTAADVLQNTPSVSVDIDGNVSLRGSESFTVLIDGKPTPLSGSDALQQIPASAIRHIEIITNPSAKYDPDGIAGIINIVSKKNALQGLTGIVNASIGTNDKYSADFLLNYKMENLAVFVGATWRDFKYIGEVYALREFQQPSNTLFDEINGERDMLRKGREIKAGMDYTLNESNTIGISGEFGYHERSFGGKQKQHLYDAIGSSDEYILSDNFNLHGADYYGITLSHTKKFNDNGHQLVSFVNYSGHMGDDSDRQVEYFTNELFEVDDSRVPNTLRAGETGNEHELRIQSDYTLPIGKDGKLEAGYQARIDSEIEEYVFENYDPDTDEWLPNNEYSSSTDFFRNIQAAYVTYGNRLKIFQYQLGLRTEYTDRRIWDAQSDEYSTIDRIDLFPSVHISRKFGNNHQVMASYSRRIDRPRGWYLEPFLSYMNSTTLRRGNPDLQPEYMNSFEIGYQKAWGRSFVAFETYYKNTVNKIERIQEVYDADEGITLLTFDNISKDHSLGAELMLNYADIKWLNVNASTTLYRYWIEGELNGVEIDTRSNNYTFRLNTTFNFSSKSRLQIMGMYMGPSVTAQGHREAFFFTNMAYRHDFLDRKLSATLQLRDIFGTMRHEFTSYGPSFESYVKFTREPRVLMLSLSYKLNNYKQRRGSGGMDEGMDMGEGGMF